MSETKMFLERNPLHLIRTRAGPKYMNIQSLWCYPNIWIFKYSIQIFGYCGGIQISGYSIVEAVSEYSVTVVASEYSDIQSLW